MKPFALAIATALALLSLDVYNEGTDSKKLGLLPTENVSGQSWKFTKVPKVRDE